MTFPPLYHFSYTSNHKAVMLCNVTPEIMLVDVKLRTVARKIKHKLVAIFLSLFSMATPCFRGLTEPGPYFLLGLGHLSVFGVYLWVCGFR